MNRFRTHWLALVGAMLLLGLSVSSAFGAHPDHPDNRGNAVSTFVHELLFGSDEESEEEQEEEGDEEGDEDTDEDEESEDEDTEETDEESEESEESDSEFKNHGHCVREVAWSLEVGGLNENHGGAVSEAARVTCSSDGEEEDGEEGTEDEEEAVEETEATAKDRGRSADAHANAPGKNKAEGARGGGNGNVPLGPMTATMPGEDLNTGTGG